MLNEMIHAKDVWARMAEELMLSAIAARLAEAGNVDRYVRAYEQEGIEDEKCKIARSLAHSREA